MSATLFLALCILGCDFLLYALFQWTYGERRRGIAPRSARPKSAIHPPDARPFLVSSRGSAVGGVERLPNRGPRTSKEEGRDPGRFGEARAYRRIAAAFAQAKR
jgi:hypothetical protein